MASYLIWGELATTAAVAPWMEWRRRWLNRDMHAHCEFPSHAERELRRFISSINIFIVVKLWSKLFTWRTMA
jgi:hypothetical protein